MDDPRGRSVRVGELVCFGKPRTGIEHDAHGNRRRHRLSGIRTELE